MKITIKRVEICKCEPLTQLVDHQERPGGAVPQHDPHVVHLGGEGALLFTGDVITGCTQEEVVIPRDLQ